MPFISDNDNLRTTQLVQDFHPILRRRAYTSIRTSFPTYFQAQHEHEQQVPLPSMNESQRIIYENFSKINHIIDVVDQHIRKRIQCYQNEVVNVVQKEIQQMREQTQKVVIQFNNMILQKNKQTQIWSLNNELDYFKSQAKKLFQSNKRLKRQYLQMKKNIQQYQWQLENREVIMQKLLYKYQKQRHSKIKLIQQMEIGKELIKKVKKNKIDRDKYKKIDVKSIVVNKQKNSENVNSRQQNGINNIKNKKDIINNNNNNHNTLHDNSILQIKFDDENDHETLSDQSFNYINNQNKNQSCSKQEFYSSLDQQQQQSRIQLVSKNHYQSVNNTNQKNNPNSNIKKSAKQIDQQSQVNIYLSQHSYKTLFDTKHHNNNVNCCNNKNSRSFYANDNNIIRYIKQTKQISTQTNNDQNHLHDNYQRRAKLQNNTYQQKSTTAPKTKSINFAKNGFTIRQGSIQKNHLRSNSYHMNSTMMKRDIQTNGVVNQINNNRNKNDRIKTQMNFNKSSQKKEFEFEMLTPKVEKTKNNSYQNNHTKMFNKMASKFQRNKIAQRAYDKSVSSSALKKQ